MSDQIDTSDEACAVVCMIVSNPGLGDRPRAWQKRVNDLIRALRDERNATQSRLAAVEKENAVLVHLGECVVDEFAGAEDGEYPAVERLNRKLEPYRIMRSLSPSVPGAQEPVKGER
jgi:hypothetical protein